MDIDKWLSERIEFYENRVEEISQEEVFYSGLAEGLQMARQFLRENYVEGKDQISNCCFLHTAAGGNCEPPEMLKCAKCKAPDGEECKVCKYTNCHHVWGKAHPIQEKQSYVCLNCGVVK